MRRLFTPETRGEKVTAGNAWSCYHIGMTIERATLADAEAKETPRACGGLFYRAKPLA